MSAHGLTAAHAPAAHPCRLSSSAAAPPPRGVPSATERSRSPGGVDPGVSAFFSFERRRGGARRPRRRLGHWSRPASERPAPDAPRSRGRAAATAAATAARPPAAARRQRGRSRRGGRRRLCRRRRRRAAAAARRPGAAAARRRRAARRPSGDRPPGGAENEPQPFSKPRRTWRRRRRRLRRDGRRRPGSGARRRAAEKTRPDDPKDGIGAARRRGGAPSSEMPPSPGMGGGATMRGGAPPPRRGGPLTPRRRRPVSAAPAAASPRGAAVGRRLKGGAREQRRGGAAGGDARQLRRLARRRRQRRRGEGHRARQGSTSRSTASSSSSSSSPALSGSGGGTPAAAAAAAAAVVAARRGAPAASTCTRRRARRPSRSRARARRSPVALGEELRELLRLGQARMPRGPALRRPLGAAARDGGRDELGERVRHLRRHEERLLGSFRAASARGGTRIFRTASFGSSAPTPPVVEQFALTARRTTMTAHSSITRRSARRVRRLPPLSSATRPRAPRSCGSSSRAPSPSAASASARRAFVEVRHCEARPPPLPDAIFRWSSSTFDATAISYAWRRATYSRRVVAATASASRTAADGWARAARATVSISTRSSSMRTTSEPPSSCSADSSAQCSSDPVGPDREEVADVVEDGEQLVLHHDARLLVVGRAERRLRAARHRHQAEGELAEAVEDRTALRGGRGRVVVRVEG